MKARPRLLFVDDEENLRTLIQAELSVEGFSVDTADDGDTAVRALQQQTYDLILLDIRMPRMNGIDVLKHMKKQKIRSRVIMLTAVDDLTTALEAIRLGANDYLTKPFDISAVVNSIRRVIAT